MLIVFDLDGTLIDSRRDLADSANATLADYGAPPLPDDLIVGMVGDGAAMLVQRSCSAAGLPTVPADALHRFIEHYEARLLIHTRPYPGTREMLEGAAKRGPLAVLTNKPEAASRQILQGIGLLGFFGQLVAGDGRWARKPQPHGLRWLVEQAGETPTSTLLVGDSIIDLQTARAARIPFCVARYGFGFATVSPHALTASDRIIDRPPELLDFL